MLFATFVDNAPLLRVHPLHLETRRGAARRIFISARYIFASLINRSPHFEDRERRFAEDATTHRFHIPLIFRSTSEILSSRCADELSCRRSMEYPRSEHYLTHRIFDNARVMRVEMPEIVTYGSHSAASNETAFLYRPKQSSFVSRIRRFPIFSPFIQFEMSLRETSLGRDLKRNRNRVIGERALSHLPRATRARFSSGLQISSRE